jgi:uncharacterized membrane protein
METRQTDTAPKETTRIEALSDGIFAIAMTLLVLEIHVPALKGGETLVRVLLDDWHMYLAFTIGFFTLLICWINHHYMFELIRRSNGVLLLLNGIKLLVVAITPFATALLSKYLGTDNQGVAVSVYALNFLFMGIAMTLLWSYAQAHGLAVSPSPGVIRMTTRLYLFATILPAFIFALSFVNIWSCLALSGFMFVMFLFPRALVSRLVGEKEEGTA